MSSSSHIFLSTSGTPDEAAGQLAAALGAERTERDGSVFISVRLDDAEVGGEVMRNIYGAPPDPGPDEVSALDGYDLAFEVRRVPADDPARDAAAHRLFDLVVERLQWPALLVDNLGTLAAAWHPAVGRTDFPAGTSADADGRELWRRYAIKPRRPT